MSRHFWLHFCARVEWVDEPPSVSVEYLFKRVHSQKNAVTTTWTVANEWWTVVFHDKEQGNNTIQILYLSNWWCLRTHTYDLPELLSKLTPDKFARGKSGYIHTLCSQGQNSKAKIEIMLVQMHAIFATARFLAIADLGLIPNTQWWCPLSSTIFT